MALEIRSNTGSWKADRWIAAGLFVVSAACLLAFRRYTSMDPDEGIVLQGAQRILHGEVLYRDFFSFLTPGSYYLLAAVFKIFGGSFLVARTILVLYGALFTIFTYAMARRTCSRSSSLFAAYLTAATCLPWRFMVLHNWDSTLCTCLSVYFAVLFMQSPGKTRAFALGSSLCLTFLFEQSKGAGLALGLLLGFVLVALVRPARPQFTRRRACALLAGCAWPLVLTLACFGSHHALRPLLSDWLWPLRHYSAANRVPYGYADWSDQARQNLFHSGSRFQTFVAFLAVSPCFILPALPLIAVLLLVQWLAPARRSAVAPDQESHCVILASTMSGLLLSVLATRANIIHFVYLAPIFYVTLAWILDGAGLSSRFLCAARPVIALLISVTFSATTMSLWIENRNARWMLATRRGAVRTVARDDLIPYVQAHVAPGERIFVYPYFPLAYYLTATFNATSFEYLQPGMHTREQSERALKQLEAAKPRVVVYEITFYDKIPASWPNTPPQALAADVLGDYILSHYHSCAILASASQSRFSFMAQDGISCPVDVAQSHALQEGSTDSHRAVPTTE